MQNGLNPQYQILLFYKYVFIENPEQVRDEQRALCEKYGFKGRLIVATEGINFTLEGKKDDTEAYIKELEKDPRFQDINFKKSVGTGNAFPKLSVKARNEIVSAHLGTCDIDPNQVTGKRLPASELHKWFEEGREFYIVDMRNAYEHSVGHFEGSFTPKMDNFRDLPKVAEEIKHLKDKTVVTVCTGGVRCEKASGFLVANGFKDVYQLENGIVTYMEKYPNEHFKGKLYVFDGRTAMGFYTDDPKHEIVGKCVKCGTSSEHFVDCLTTYCGRHFILCEDCEKTSLDTKGNLHCPHGCDLRKPEKIRSPFMKLLLKIRYLFK
jgi:UPF0176 protein